MYAHINMECRCGKFSPELRNNGGNKFIYLDKSGTPQEAVSFWAFVNDKKGKKLDDSPFEVTVYGFMAQRCLEKMSTGCSLHLEGSVSVDTFIPKGSNEKVTVVNVTIGNSFGTVHILESAKKEETQEAQDMIQDTTQNMSQETPQVTPVTPITPVTPAAVETVPEIAIA